MPIADEDRPYGVATHLNAGGTIGFVPERVFWIVLAGLFVGSLPAFLIFLSQRERHETGAHVLVQIAITVGVLIAPCILLSPFMMWFVEPPVEHGLMCWLAHLTRRKMVFNQHLKSLKNIEVTEEGYIKVKDGLRAILILPSLNLELESGMAKKRHIARFGRMLDGISTHPFQFVIRSRMQTSIRSIERMKRHPSPVARRLAEWLGEHYKSKQAIDRVRYMVIPAPDVETLTDRLDGIQRTLRRAKLEGQLVTDPLDARAILNDFWTLRPHTDRLGPELIRVEANYLIIDGEYVSIIGARKLPTTIMTNWWSPLTDGDLPVDVIMTCEQENLMLAKMRLEHKFNNLSASAYSPGRKIAIQQIDQLRAALETKVRPWEIQMMFVVRGHDQKTHDRYVKRLKQQILDMGGQANSLTWEHLKGMESVQPLCQPMLPHRKMQFETGTVARTTPMAASTLQMYDGVPFGMSNSVAILLTTLGKKMGRHFGWYGKSGAGKGFALRCYLARRYFADGLRIFIWDADKARHEYAERFMKFIGGQRLELRTIEECKNLLIDPRWDAMTFDVSGMDIEDQPAAFAIIKKLVEEHVIKHPGESAFVVDEATTLTDHPDQSGARALADSVQQWRRLGIEVHVVTQRVSDFLFTALGNKIQDILSVKWYGEQEPTQISRIADKAGWTEEEQELIGGAGTGQALVIAFGQRIWSDLFDHCSEEEYAAYETDYVEKPEVTAQHARLAAV